MIWFAYAPGFPCCLGVIKSRLIPKTHLVAIMACLIVLGVLAPRNALSRLIHIWTLEGIANEAKVVVVGEVLEVQIAGRLAPERTRWNTPLFQMRAKVRVLRLSPGSADLFWAPKRTFWLWYLNEDLGEGRPGNRWFPFPDLAVGDVFAFPLREPVVGNLGLIAEENTGLLVPCLREAPTEAKPTTCLEFLQQELVNTLSKGDFAALCKAAKYPSPGRTDQFATFGKMLEQQIGDDEARWITLAVVGYCATIPNRTLAELPDPAEQDSDPERPRLLFVRPPLHERLAGLAMRHVHDPKWKERFVATALSFAPLHSSYQVAVAIEKNFPSDPDILAILAKALDEHQPGVLAVIISLIHNIDHPLIDPARRAAMASLRSHRKAASADFISAWRFILNFGDEQQFAWLLRDLIRSQKSDRQRFMTAWRASAEGKNTRLIELCRVVIEDRGRYHGSRWRFCDSAGFTLQQLTGADFGFANDQSAAERDAAVTKAKAWLKKNPKP